MFNRTMVRGLLAAVAAWALFFHGPGPVKADVIYDFEDVTNGTSTPFSETKGGITAFFSTPGDPNGFSVDNASGFGFLPPMAGQVLINLGGTLNDPLDVSFNQPLSSVSLNFALDQGPAALQLLAYSGATPVGSVSVSGDNSYYPQGTISFGGATFDNIVLQSASATAFAVDNLDVVPATSSASIPEPRPLALFAVPAIALLAWAWRRRLRAA